MRRSSAAALLVLGILALLPSRPATADSAHRHANGPDVAALNDADLLRALEGVFEPAPLRRGETPTPVRCASLLVREARQRRDRLDDEARARLDAWTSPMAVTPTTATAPSILGRFELVYETSGSNAVPLDDVAPANGIPDYVERVGAYFEESWTVSFEQLGFVAPDISEAPYRVEFRNFNAYGVTFLTDEGSAGTFIQVHHDFLGFPPNDDPEGNQWGAAKVTAAHELKHASQFTNNGFTEPGLWVEVDATWMEDVVYDQVNDFYNYIPFGSPITAPSSSLDPGAAYDDAVWQHWISESYGVGAIVGFWSRRSDQPLEPIMESYDWILDAFGAPIVESWIDFASWNAATGSSARGGFGYGEAAEFPDPTLTAAVAVDGASFSGSVARLAAHFLRVTDFTPDTPGVVVIEAQVLTSSPLRARALIDTRDGGFVVEHVDLTDGSIELQTPLTDVDTLTLVVAHGDLAQGGASYQIDVVENEQIPAPIAALASQDVRFRIASGDTDTRSLELRNEGDATSVLDFDAAVVVPPPVASARSILGSTLAFDRKDYEPGTAVDVLVTVTNRSVDFEWLTAIEIDLPAGVRALAGGDFVTEAAQRLVSDGTTGDGVTLGWFDPDGAWGNVQNGQTATAELRLAFDDDLRGDLLIPYRLEGDGFGGEVGTVEDGVLLGAPKATSIEIERPARLVRVGTTIEVTWTAIDATTVALDLSRDDGATWTPLVDATGNDGTWNWSVDGETSYRARLRVRDVDDPLSIAETASRFTVARTVDWATITPASGEVPGGDTTDLLLAVDATALTEGMLQAELAIVYDGTEAPLTAAIELQVSNDGTSNPSPPRAIVHGARPNPFNPQTAIAFELPLRADVRIDVFDLHGRRIRALHDDALDAGPHAVPWLGRDDDGQRVATGVYLVRVAIDGEATFDKVSLIK